jgi:hypothetical protein
VYLDDDSIDDRDYGQCFDADYYDSQTTVPLVTAAYAGACFFEHVSDALYDLLMDMVAVTMDRLGNDMRNLFLPATISMAKSISSNLMALESFTHQSRQECNGFVSPPSLATDEFFEDYAIMLIFASEVRTARLSTSHLLLTNFSLSPLLSSCLSLFTTTAYQLGIQEALRACLWKGLF